ncbi:MAG: DUF3866 family protein, partial [Desulfobacterales bacterium]|nr:DUF3866 family protein [Desulfobacterales bacterium]
SPYHQKLANANSLNGMPVIVAPLHSMVTPIVAVIKALSRQMKIVYLMSDGGALPLAFSNLIRFLKDCGWISATITFGHAFGGDYEAVNVYTGLLTAKSVLNADIAIIAMGPGIVGTNTPYGFTGVEQADFLHAVHLLAGEPIAVPRISFADERPRHQGISHHSRTVLGQLTLVRSKIAIPCLIPEREKLLEEQLITSQIKAKHIVSYHSTIKVEEILRDDSLNLRTMGRNFSEDKEFFLTAGLAGKLAIQFIKPKRVNK